MELQNPCIAIELSKDAGDTTRDWLVGRLQDHKCDGGSQLEVTKEVIDGSEFLFVGANNQRALIGAEIIGIRKRYKDGDMREFCFSDRENYTNFQDDDFLSESEKLQIIKTEMDGLRAFKEEFIPGHENAKLYPGKSIFRRMETSDLIANMFCLHDRNALEQLRIDWYRHKHLTLEQPLDKIFQYFGGTISLYFSFLGFYTKMLISLATFSAIYYIITSRNAVMDYAGFATFNLFWSAVFLELWKRKEAGYAYRWGSYGRKEWEEPRPAYHGPMGKNPITYREEPTYPKWKRQLRFFAISVPTVFICVVLAVGIMFYYFSWELYFMEKYADDASISASVMVNLPSVIYSILIIVANLAYRNLAERLTDLENHRLESSYVNHLISKIVLFNFVNNFLCLYYIAFIYNNMAMLRTTLRNLFLVQILISQAIESLLPYFQYKLRARGSPFGKTNDDKAEISVAEQVRLEVKKDVYMGTFDDYMELWLQFGYVVLFSCVYPAAAILALVNNIVEIRSDAFKLCNAMRRPFADGSNDIGAWQTAFSLLSYLAVTSNCALIFQSPSFLKWFYSIYPTASGVEIVLVFLVVEHLLLGVRYFVGAIISDTPTEVAIAEKRMQYRSIQALKRQRANSLTPLDHSLHDFRDLVQSSRMGNGSVEA